ncbi:MAG: iron-containing alcohol dehydrogenase [Lachnospirales bacterium]
MSKRIVLNSLSYHGTDTLLEINTEVKRRNLKKAFFIVDKALEKTGVSDKVLDVLKGNHLDFELFTNFKSNPSVKNLKDGLNAFKISGADYVISLGGGSSMVMGKAISVVANNEEYSDFESLEGEIFTKHLPVTMFAIPTTAGTGSETSMTISFHSTDTQKQYLSTDANYVPTVAFVDSILMKTMPRGLAAATGMDALTHAIESYISSKANTITEMYSLKAIELLGGNLEKSLDGDEKALENVALGQYLAGQAFTNAGLGLVHAMADSLGALYDTPHGLANAIILPVVLEYNQKGTHEKYKYIARALGKTGLTIMTKEQYREEAVLAVQKLSKNIGIPKNLMNIAEIDDLDTLVNLTLNSVYVKTNPRTVTDGVVRSLFLKLI